ncbi:hypothetical protein V1525DRAFT_434462 [Lipomyces kononenkoae]|uniref:Uncharacterized protein n=1 Tax=Lipomyces kononenkoae TaxID=34357 RepID=A0ACC3SVN5_LIPKO
MREATYEVHSSYSLLTNQYSDDLPALYPVMVDPTNTSDTSGSVSASDQTKSQSSSTSEHSSSNVTYMKVPSLIKILFDQFPLVKYAESSLPSACIFPTPSEKIGTVFVQDITDDSIYPQSIQLLSILKLSGIFDRFTTIPSSSHAAPKSGTVPYIFLPSRPKVKSDLLPRTIYPESKVFYLWLASIAPSFPEFDYAGQSPLLSLIDVRIRDAWVLTLYLYPVNYESIFIPRLSQAYSQSDASASILPRILAYTTLHDAQQLLRQSTGVPSITETIQRSIIANAEEALDAFANLLVDSGKPYLDGDDPGVLDAALYGYIEPILRLDIRNRKGDAQAELKTLVTARNILVEWAERIHDRVCNL